MEGSSVERERRAAGQAGFDPSPWRAELVAFVRRMGAAGEAEDVVHEVFVRALASPPAQAPRAWLYRVALNVLADRARTVRTAGELACEPRDPAPAAEERLAERELAGLAARAIEALAPKQRAAILLRVLRHMDYDEVATALDCSVATARQHFHLAVKAVRDELARRGGHDG
jgi:RNA polymerase sigma-70 factor (ECF subfamily)